MLVCLFASVPASLSHASHKTQNSFQIFFMHLFMAFLMVTREGTLMYKSLADLCPHWEFSSDNMFASYCPGSVRM